MYSPFTIPSLKHIKKHVETYIKHIKHMFLRANRVHFLIICFFFHMFLLFLKLLACKHRSSVTARVEITPEECSMVVSFVFLNCFSQGYETLYDIRAAAPGCTDAPGHERIKERKGCASMDNILQHMITSMFEYNSS